MPLSRIHATIFAVLVTLAALAPSSAAAATLDRKVIHPTACMPVGPNTTIDELDISGNGIYNPGTEIEKVICPLPRDQEIQYTSGQLTIYIYYRVLGAGSTSVTCTLTVGSTSMQTQSVYTNTKTGALKSNGGRGELLISGATQSPDWFVVPSSLTCAIPPKTSLGAIYQGETGTTNTP